MAHECAPIPPCLSWVEAFSANRPPLHVSIYDGVSRTAACSSGQSLRITVYLDEVPVGFVDMPCLDESREETAPSYRIDGPPAPPGLHELRVDVQSARGIVQGKTLLSLPAFDLPPGGRSIVFGAEIAVGVGPDDLAIGPPQVYPPRGL